MICLAAVKLADKQREIDDKFLKRALREDRFPWIGRQKEVKGRLRAISAKIDWLEPHIEKAKNELEVSAGKTDALSDVVTRRLRSDIIESEKELLELHTLIEDYAETEKGIYKPVLKETAIGIMKAMGIEKPGYWQTGKMIFALKNGIPMKKERLSWSKRRLKKFGIERARSKEYELDTAKDVLTGEERIISLWHPNMEAIYLDAKGKSVLCVANGFGILHYHGPEAGKAWTDFTTFKPKVKRARGQFEKRLLETETKLRADINELYDQIERQLPRKIEARAT